MRKHLLLILFLLIVLQFSTQVVSAQNRSYKRGKYQKRKPIKRRSKTRNIAVFKPRHIRGQQGIELSTGLSGTSLNGRFISGAYSAYLSRNSYFKLGVGYETLEFKELGYEGYLVDGLLAFSPVDINKTVFFNVLGGFSFSYDGLADKEVIDLENSFSYGGQVGFEIETFISHEFIFLVAASQKYMLKSTYGNQRFFAGAGLKYIF